MTLPGPPGLEASRHVWAWMERLRGLEGVVNLHPAYCSLLVEFDPSRLVPQDFRKAVEERIASGGELSPHPERTVVIPVCYDGEDLSEVARQTGLSEREVVRLHTRAEYRVAFLGFSPGFPYLLGLPKALEVPRRLTPRLKVPAGSVAIAGLQTGVYPQTTPGGWQLLGRTPLRMFDPQAQAPSLLEPGDRVRFEEAGVYKESLGDGLPAASKRDVGGIPVLEVQDPGLLTSIQDLGRPGFAHWGVSAGGAADPFALRMGNRLLGNGEGAAALEISAAGARLKIRNDTWICLTGAEAQCTLDGRPLQLWRTQAAMSGQILNVGPASRHLRTYLCVRGGLCAPRLLGSRSDYISASWSRPVQKGDVLSAEKESAGVFSHQPLLIASRIYDEDFEMIRVTRGPQWDWFTEKSRKVFFSAEFTVTEQANRMGIRLHGPFLSWEPGKSELVSEGVANGAIQIPAGGQPLILFCEQRSTGGYPKIANVIRADAFRMGQLRPGQKLRFREVSLEEAWSLCRESI